ncbi:hypothetical protein, partial [Brevundimonas sp.]|uniref:hypothetical protein n=1 Tax=Brevundimonas sp. TaxID=1871086 RepID=UPI002AB8B60E
MNRRELGLGAAVTALSGATALAAQAQVQTQSQARSAAAVAFYDGFNDLLARVPASLICSASTAPAPGRPSA